MRSILVIKSVVHITVLTLPCSCLSIQRPCHTAPSAPQTHQLEAEAIVVALHTTTFSTSVLPCRQYEEAGSTVYLACKLVSCWSSCHLTWCFPCTHMYTLWQTVTHNHVSTGSLWWFPLPCMWLGAETLSSLHCCEKPLQSEELGLHEEGASDGAADLWEKLSHAAWLFNVEEE